MKTPTHYVPDWEFLRAQVEAQDTLPTVNARARQLRADLIADLEALRYEETPEPFRAARNAQEALAARKQKRREEMYS